MSDKTIILIGYSGHGLVAADTALENKFRIVGYCEREEKIYNTLNLCKFTYMNKKVSLTNIIIIFFFIILFKLVE